MHGNDESSRTLLLSQSDPWNSPVLRRCYLQQEKCDLIIAQFRAVTALLLNAALAQGKKVFVFVAFENERHWYAPPSSNCLCGQMVEGQNKATEQDWKTSLAFPYWYTCFFHGHGTVKPAPNVEPAGMKRPFYISMRLESLFGCRAKLRQKAPLVNRDWGWKAEDMLLVFFGAESIAFSDLKSFGYQTENSWRTSRDDILVPCMEHAPHSSPNVIFYDKPLEQPQSKLYTSVLPPP